MYVSVLKGNNGIFKKNLIKIYNLQRYLGKPTPDSVIPRDCLWGEPLAPQTWRGREETVVTDTQEVAKWSWPPTKVSGLPLRDIITPHPTSRDVVMETNASDSLPPHHPRRHLPNLACISHQLNLQPKVKEIYRAAKWICLTDHDAGWRTQRWASWGTHKTSSLKGYMEDGSEQGRVASLVEGIDISFVHVQYNKDSLTIRTPVTYTFSALGSIKVWESGSMIICWYCDRIFFSNMLKSCNNKCLT